MDINIKCTKDEFAQLVRACTCADIGDYCHACLIHAVGACDDGCAGIEHVVSVDLVEDGAADG